MSATLPLCIAASDRIMDWAVRPLLDAIKPQGTSGNASFRPSEIASTEPLTTSHAPLSPSIIRANRDDPHA